MSKSTNVWDEAKPAGKGAFQSAAIVFINRVEHTGSTLRNGTGGAGSHSHPDQCVYPASYATL